MINARRVLFAAMSVVCLAATGMAQNFNNANAAASVSSSPVLMIIGAVVLVGIGLVIGFAAGKRRNG